LASRSPVTSASYSAVLLVAEKLNLNHILKYITFGWDEHDVSSCPF
jgi:hypothetical protein